MKEKIEKMESYKSISIIEEFSLKTEKNLYQVRLYSDNFEIIKTGPDTKKESFQTSPTLMYKIAKRTLKIMKLYMGESSVSLKEDTTTFRLSTDFDQYFLKCVVSQDANKKTQLKLFSFTNFNKTEEIDCSITIENMCFIKLLMERVKTIIKRSDIEL